MKSRLKIYLTAILLASIFFSGCLENQKTAVSSSPARIPIEIRIDERTGDLSSAWLNQKPGWYDLYTSGKVGWYTDTGINPSMQRNIGLLLVTEDTTPSFVIRSVDGYSTVDSAIYRVSNVPRGYLMGGRRLYQITISYDVKDIASNNIITIKDDYYDVKDEIFHIQHRPDGILGYS